MSKFLVEDAPFSSFHRRLTIFAGGGNFLDGYLITIISVALAQLGPQLHLNTFWLGLIGASTLIGIFVGGLVFGYLTDVIGRKAMYTIDLLMFIVASILQMFVQTGIELFILRFIIGVAIGADYPISTALLAEFAPRKQRGAMLGMLLFWWYVGATVADIVGYLLLDMGPEAWRWMLGSSAIPAIAIVFMRFGTPESPRWLVSKNRIDEARDIVHRIYGPNADFDAFLVPVEKTRFSKLFEPGYLKRTLFVGLFWMFSIIPAFGIYTFGPQVLDAFHLGHGKLSYIGSAVISLFFLIGIIPTLFLVNKLGRRKLLIWTFAFMVVGLLILGIFPNAPVGVIILGFAIYAIFSAGPNVLDYVYPNEIFPTEIRASAVGVGTAISRIGAAIGTFALPYSLTYLGIGTTMLIGAGITALGLIVSIAWAPETTGRTLEESSSLQVDNLIKKKRLEA